MVVASILTVTLALAAETGTEGPKPSRIRMPGHGALIFDVPAAWKVSASQASERTTIRFDPPAGQDFAVIVTPIFPGTSTGEPLSLPKIRQGVEAARNAAKGGKPDPVRELSAGPVDGYYYATTDPKSKGKPGDWRYVTMGSALFEDLVLAFTILSNDPQQPEAAATFEMFRTLKREPASPAAPGAAQTSERQEIKVALPDKAWALVLDLPGFRVEEQGVRPDQTGAMMQAKNDQTGLMASAFVEREKTIDSLEECKKKYWGKSSGGPLRKTEVHEVTQGEMIAVHYMIPEFQGIAARQKNVNAYLYREGTCIDVHLSKVRYEPEDEALFDAVLGSVRFADK
jgi:hypothetical protein